MARTTPLSAICSWPSGQEITTPLAPMMVVFSALSASPGARAFYDQHRARGDTHNRALRALANRLVGILHGCLTHGTVYDEDVAWSHRSELAA